MIINPHMLNGTKCPYCRKASEFVDSEVIYGKSYGMIYYCKPCDAYVGVHKGTKQALGRLANRELRAWKKSAHAHFDNLWEQKMQQGFSKTKARRSAYKWLSECMRIPINRTHIGMFDVEQCSEVVELCRPYFKNISK